jgi:hypothetical protein
MALTLQGIVDGTGFESHLALRAPFVVIGDPDGPAAVQRRE